MRKLTAAMNMTLDGFCDHTAMIADDEIHQYYTDLLRSAGAVIYGRVTYQLMEFWPSLVKNPSGVKAMDDFAVAIDDVLKIVFSRTLKNVTWRNTQLKSELTREGILELKQQTGKDVFVGSPGMIAALTRMNLIDEYQLVVHPIILGSGLVLFKDLKDRVDMKLLKTKTFGCGAIAQYYAKK